MTAKNTRTSPGKPVRYAGLDDLPAAPPLAPQIRAMGEGEIAHRASADPDAGTIPADFWDQAQVVEPEGTQQITLRLPRRVLRHFKATGKGYQSRISAVLASYVDRQKKLG